MRFKKVFFIYPNYRGTTFTMPIVPVGLGYLAEYISQHGIDYRVIDMKLGHFFYDLKKIVNDFHPDLIGISLMSFMYKDHYEFIREIKNNFPGIPIVAGGPHISTVKEKVLKDCPAIDFGIMQEGEGPFLSLCQGKNITDIPGLIYREEERVVLNPIGVSQEIPLDKLPFPRYEHFELEKYGYGVSISSSRGCPYECIYCTASVTRMKFRARSANHIVDEIEYWYKRGYREFDLQEDNPTFNKNRIFEFCEEIEKRDLKDLVIMCGNGVRADRVDGEILRRLKKVGVKRLAFGVEAGNNKVLNNIKKGETIEVIKKAIKEACDLGFFVSIFFIIGSPGETMEDVQDSFDIALSYPISHVNFFNLIPLPSTALYKWVEENNYFLMPPEIYLNTGPSIQMSCKPVFQTPYFTKRQRIKALKRGKNIERIIKRRTIIRTLKKWDPFNYIVAWFYMAPIIQNLENQLLLSSWSRKLISSVRNRIRILFYK